MRIGVMMRPDRRNSLMRRQEEPKRKTTEAIADPSVERVI